MPGVTSVPATFDSGDVSRQSPNRTCKEVSSTSTDTLAPGHVVTVEPGVYLPDEGGVRIEDTVIVTDSGCTPLTHAPKDLVIS